MSATTLDKNILVTGANRGIGLSIVAGLLKAGAKVGAVRRSAADDDELSDLAAAYPEQLSVFIADVSDERQVKEAVDTFALTTGALDCLISNAAWMPPRTNVENVDATLLDTVFKTNVYGSLYLTKHALPHMIDNGGGRIIYITSVLGTSPNAGLFPYAATKAALNTLNTVVHKEHSPQGVRTVAIAPGLTDTAGMRASVGPEYIEKITSTYSGDALGAPADIVPYILFFCSPGAETLSGSVVYIRPAASA